jgi:hypothetical protein
MTDLAAPALKFFKRNNERRQNLAPVVGGRELLESLAIRRLNRETIKNGPIADFGTRAV